MTQLNLFNNINIENLTGLIDDLVIRGGMHSRFSAPKINENKTLVLNIKSKNIQMDDAQIRGLAVKHWLAQALNVSENTLLSSLKNKENLVLAQKIVPQEVGYKIANLGNIEDIKLALEIVGANAVGKFGQNIATRVISRFSQDSINTVISHHTFSWDNQDVKKDMLKILEKKHHSVLSNILKSDSNVFDYFQNEQEQAQILLAISSYLDNSTKSSMLQFNCGRMIDIIYEQKWNIQPIEHLLDNTYWGKQLKSVLEERWMLENIPDAVGKNNNHPKF